MSKLLLDGSKIPAKDFYEQFEQIVGCTENEWINKDTTKFYGDGEWYEYQDNNFTMGGTAYSAPVLYKN